MYGDDTNYHVAACTSSESAPILLAECSVPTQSTRWNLQVYGTDPQDRTGELIALVHGDVSALDPPPLVRLQSACLTGEVLGSLRCDCSLQLLESQRQIAGERSGLVLYFLHHEGRGIGLVNKIRAYQLQENGLDTAAANLALGLPADARDYGLAAAVLRRMMVTRLRLLTNNPLKERALLSAGIVIVERRPLAFMPNLHNSAYLESKRTIFGHYLKEFTS